MSALVYSSSLVAAFLGGILALFAPCCVVSLLPTFVGTALERGRQRLPLTALLFAAGVAAVLLPVVLGIGALGQVFATQRRWVFLIVGLFLGLLGLGILSGRQWMLPMPALRLRTGGTSGASVFALGIASGVASSCCAPVVAGVVAMSALASTIPGALGLALSYVFGMVFPLFLAVIFWERLPLRMRKFRAGPSPIRFGSRRLPWADLVAGGMFLTIAAFALYLSVTGQMSYSPDWLTAWNRWATSTAGGVAVGLGGLPVGVQAFAILLLGGAIGLSLYRSWRHSSAAANRDRPKMARDESGKQGAEGASAIR